MPSACGPSLGSMPISLWSASIRLTCDSGLTPSSADEPLTTRRLNSSTGRPSAVLVWLMCATDTATPSDPTAHGVGLHVVLEKPCLGDRRPLPPDPVPPALLPPAQLNRTAETATINIALAGAFNKIRPRSPRVF